MATRLEVIAHLAKKTAMQEMQDSEQDYSQSLENDMDDISTAVFAGRSMEPAEMS